MMNHNGFQDSSRTDPSRTVNSTNPWLLVMMVDDSHSMSADWGGLEMSMSELVEMAINRTLYDMGLEYCLQETKVRDRIHLKVLVYRADGEVVDPMPNGSKATYHKAPGEDGWVQNYHDTMSYSHQSVSSEVPRWVILSPRGKTPMLEAFGQAREVVQQHVAEYPKSFPPMVLNISDGEPTDCGEPVNWDLISEVCDSIRSLGSDGAEPIICNVHLDARGRNEPTLYPAEPPILDNLESGLWHISSEVPRSLEEFLPAEVESGQGGRRRMFVYNSDLPTFSDFLEFCTSRTNRTKRSTPSFFARLTVTDEDESTFIDAEYTEEE